MFSHVALLRGINVGGKNILPMAELAKIFVAAGANDVRTYIQSGNVVFSAKPAVAGKIAAAVSKRIKERFGIQIPVVVRSVEDVRRVMEGNPYIKAGKDAATCHVAFLADEPKASGVAALDPQRSPGDSFAVIGREIYLHLPNGVADSKFTNAYFDSKLATICTARNWRTVTKLLEMMQAMGAK